jgi:hypothetical protein
MKTLTVVYITSRDHPEIGWFLDSLRLQRWELTRILIISTNLKLVKYEWFEVHRPKPNVWQGPHRLTKQDWWGISNSRNTGLCLCQTEWIAFLDDRSVLMPIWMTAVEDAMNGNYCVCGPYQKRTGMTVEKGVIKHGGIITGEDSRLAYVRQYWQSLTNPYTCGGEWTFGASLALPTEWALAVNGFEELCDGLGSEDTLFGQMVANNGYPIKYDTRMSMVEDRTPEKSGPVMRRTDKGVSPNDKSHKILEVWKGAKRTNHQWDLRRVRADVLSGKPFPIPTGPETDWFDGEPLKDMI